jgi:hypothetical protein
MTTLQEIEAQIPDIQERVLDNSAVQVALGQFLEAKRGLDDFLGPAQEKYHNLVLAERLVETSDHYQNSLGQLNEATIEDARVRNNLSSQDDVYDFYADEFVKESHRVSGLEPGEVDVSSHFGPEEQIEYYRLDRSYLDSRSDLNDAIVGVLQEDADLGPNAYEYSRLLIERLEHVQGITNEMATKLDHSESQEFARAQEPSVGNDVELDGAGDNKNSDVALVQAPPGLN